MRNVNELHGYTVGQTVEFIHPDEPENGWVTGVVAELDEDEDFSRPYAVTFPGEDSPQWLKSDAIRFPHQPTAPVQLQYRVQTSAMGHISKWREVPLGQVSVTLDYREVTISTLDYIEVRVKPTFVPGYYLYIGENAAVHPSPTWFDSEFSEWDNGSWQRVNVTITPAE